MQETNVEKSKYFQHTLSKLLVKPAPTKNFLPQALGSDRQ
ncbi:hypothetical protein MICCA_3640030 [Microcystis aeruginosa PCC 9432]|uniref:Uncharacterized protein n=1 Tax=Microcystis aeruginosa PCC 9432 TaxID=1160280 RepID=A0A822LDN5_MICAE|nr:hypothetical protein MICCA_3640030 [Microcystis aeruginosa PCC 9432]